MYGLSLANVRRPEHEHGSITVLRSKGIGAVGQPNGSYLVAGTILWWPKQGFWQRPDGTFGYDLAGLIAAILPAPTAAIKTASHSDLPPVNWGPEAPDA